MTSDKQAGVLICCALGVAGRIFAGDAVAIGYNSDGVWTSVTYYASSTPNGGKDYKTESEARAEAERDLRTRGLSGATRIEILASSDTTTFAAIARGKRKSGEEMNVVGYGKTQRDADRKAIAQLNAAGASAKQQVIYRYFSHGSEPDRHDQ